MLLTNDISPWSYIQRKELSPEQWVRLIEMRRQAVKPFMEQKKWLPPDELVKTYCLRKNFVERVFGYRFEDYTTANNFVNTLSTKGYFDVLRQEPQNENREIRQFYIYGLDTKARWILFVVIFDIHDRREQFKSIKQVIPADINEVVQAALAVGYSPRKIWMWFDEQLKQWHEVRQSLLEESQKLVDDFKRQDTLLSFTGY